MRARSTTSARYCRVTTGGVIDSEATRRSAVRMGVRYTERSASRDFVRRRGTEVVVTGAPRKRLVLQGARGFESHPLRHSTRPCGSAAGASLMASRGRVECPERFQKRESKGSLRSDGHAKAVSPKRRSRGGGGSFG